MIADSGSSGTVPPAPHLHFHVFQPDTNNKPVDASALFGFVPNLNYPSIGGTCGQIVNLLSAPVIIEAVAFSIRTQPRQGHYWFCYTGGHVSECYMQAVPNNYALIEINGTLTNPDSPRLEYRVYVPQSPNYRIWVCAKGGSGSDDSLHMGLNNVATALSTKITSVNWQGASWAWASYNMSGGIPALPVVSGWNYVNVWMREDGLRINRILLTPDYNFVPTNIRCTSYP